MLVLRFLVLILYLLILILFLGAGILFPNTNTLSFYVGASALFLNVGIPSSGTSALTSCIFLSAHDPPSASSPPLLTPSTFFCVLQSAFIWYTLLVNTNYLHSLLIVSLLV